MTLDISVLLRNAMLQVLADSIDAGAPVPGRFLIYDGARPEPGAPVTGQVLLAECPCSLPCGSVANGALTFAQIAEEDLAPASGTAAWGRLVDGAGNWIADWDVGDLESEAFLKLNNTQVYQGGIVRITSGSLTI